MIGQWIPCCVCVMWVVVVCWVWAHAWALCVFVFLCHFAFLLCVTCWIVLVNKHVWLIDARETRVVQKAVCKILCLLFPLEFMFSFLRYVYWTLLSLFGIILWLFVDICCLVFCCQTTWSQVAVLFWNLYRVPLVPFFNKSICCCR